MFIVGVSPEPEEERVRSRERSGAPVTVEPRRGLGVWWRKNFGRLIFRRVEVELVVAVEREMDEECALVVCCREGKWEIYVSYSCSTTLKAFK